MQDFLNFKKQKIVKKSLIFLFLFSEVFIFQYYKYPNVQSLLNCKNNDSWKFEVSSSKNEREDRFLVNFQTS